LNWIQVSAVEDFHKTPDNDLERDNGDKPYCGSNQREALKPDSWKDALQRSWKEMSSPKFKSVEEYLASLDAAKAKTLRSVIDLILTQFPELESIISWNVPTIHRNGKYVVGLAAYKNHLTFTPWSPRILEGFAARLGKYVVFKNCFQIPVDWDIDRELVRDLVRARLAELD
jgi:uncharacterized protein